ncbi:MAG: ribose 5-phosphate isomerase B [Candidatus Rokubacteria bacterium]|nr:ribose 5-phosphate isomerase B [Candidatus Rokubacteria bacterium]MBI4594686.1 ribose 5-phosphate isomerase B [Candidatus Rokubacteria bacterium]
MTVIAVGADHAGFSLKEELKSWLVVRGYQVHDVGTSSLDSVDYPDFAARVAEAVMGGVASRGVLVCGTGLGMAMVANKFAGVRAAACGDPYTARMSREHNDCNVLALGARITERDAAIAILKTWLETAFAGGRHARRLEKLTALEEKAAHAPAP